MVKRNVNFLNLSENYLFPEVTARVQRYKKEHPDVDLLSLSIGDTSEPLTPTTTEGLIQRATQMGVREGYQGYGAEQGDPNLRRKIAEIFYQQRLDPDEIFISDGAKCDIGRLQILFGSSASMAVQDPTYPAYVDSGILQGKRSIYYLPCHKENHFFPDLGSLPKTDLIYICSPNNPTGAVATKEQLSHLVTWALKTKTIIIFDAAYSGFIQDPELPRSIYEIEGAKEVAIEVSSFSKLIGFTGVRVGWSVVPKTLCFEEGHSVHKDYNRLITTIFNGASIISQAGALAALNPIGLKEMKDQLSFYLENAQIIKSALKEKGLSIYGGENAPYLWIDFGKKSSWELFQILLEQAGIISTPGSGFGEQGEGYLRLTAFGSRPHILKAKERILKRWPANLL